MILLGDIGNTSITLGSWKDGEVREVRRVPSAPASEREWEGAFGGAQQPIVLASVNPPALSRLEAFLARSFPGRPVRVAQRDFKIPIGVEVRNPDEVGVDRLLNACAAHRRTGGSAVVVDLGTATTFDVVSKEGAYLGGAIAPGISLCLRALNEHTALLPHVSPEEPAEPVGRDTRSCLSIGVVEGYRGLVRHLVGRFERALPPPVTVLLTGGEAPWIASAFPDFQHVPELTLEGLGWACPSSIA